MRPVFGLFTALPVTWDPSEDQLSWGVTPLVGLVLGVGWVLFHQSFIQIGGPFVAAAGVLLLHVALTGGRTVRGLAGLVTAMTVDPLDEPERVLPAVEGAGTAVVTVFVLIMASFLILSDVAPAALLLVPLIGRAVQALLTGPGVEAIGLDPPDRLARVVIVGGTVAAMFVAPLMAVLVRPVRLNPVVEGVEYVALGVVAFAVSVAVAWLWRGWIMARFGQVDPNGWHSIGAVADVVALAVVVGRIG